MSLRTSLCDRLEIQYPIVQAPIGSATTPDLAATVSSAGGLGHFAVTYSSNWNYVHTDRTALVRSDVH